MSMNAFRILADVSHAASKCILIWAIHSNRSAEGVSLLTQLMYAVVFVTRYLDLFWVAPHRSYWNFCLKIFHITSSLYIIFLMMKVYARSREREKAWRLAAYLNLGALACAPLLRLIPGTVESYRLVFEILWSYSIIIEAFCILPQLILLRQTTIPTVIDSYYLVTLGSYRFLYILNWIYRIAHHDNVKPVKIISGIVQVAFYIDFAWVYWTRQRVKLRAGGIVDTDDLRKGFLVNRFVDHRTSLDEEAADPTAVGGDNDGDGTIRPRTVNRWGNRGISISADDTISASEGTRSHGKASQPAVTGSRPERSPVDNQDDTFLSDEDEDAAILSGTGGGVLDSGAQWRESGNEIK